MMARASSGSRSAINSVEPLMSANSAVTIFRSPSIGWSAIEDLSICAAAWSSVVAPNWDNPSSNFAAHWPQNFAAAEFSKRHFAHVRLSAAPHSLQNLSPSGLSALQLEQRISHLDNGARSATRRHVERRAATLLQADVARHSGIHGRVNEFRKLDAMIDRDQLGGAFADHDARRVDVSADDIGHDAGVRHPQLFHACDP